MNEHHFDDATEPPTLVSTRVRIVLDDDSMEAEPETLEQVRREMGETLSAWWRRVRELRAVVLDDDLKTVISRKNGAPGSLWAKRVPSSWGEWLVPLGALANHYARIDHPDTRAVFRARFARIYKEAGAQKAQCRCPTTSKARRAILFTFDGCRHYDAEGNAHVCEKTK